MWFTVNSSSSRTYCEATSSAVEGYNIIDIVVVLSLKKLMNIKNFLLQLNNLNFFDKDHKSYERQITFTQF